jgi:oleate hydratase
LYLFVFPNLLQRIGLLLSIAGVVYCLIQIRLQRPRPMPDAGETESIRFYRAELERLRDFHRKKPMHECTGDEIMTEVLYHLGLLDMKNELLAHTSISTCMMPYINSQFMPRKVTDRPQGVPKGCTNLGFIGQYVEVKDDAVFTVETSVRTAMEAVYALTKLDRDVPEVYPSRFDIRCAIGHMKRFAGVKGKFTEADLPKINPLMLVGLKKKIAELLNSVPMFPCLYTGRDQSVAEKESVLHPQYPVDK